MTTEALVREIRRFRPHVMTTYDENGGYPHPDHIMCHEVSMAAFEAAGDPTAYPSAGEPWQPLKIYYNQTFSRGRVVAFHEALTALGEESPYAAWLENWAPERERTVTTRVRCDAWFDRRDAALLAHATQIDPDGTFFKVSREEQARVWPWEDYEAGMSYVPIVEGEDDLFAGLPDRRRRGGRARDLRHPHPRPRRTQGAHRMIAARCCSLALPPRAPARARQDLTPSQQAAPGLWAFLAFVFLAVALWLLMRNMNARLRRMSYRPEGGGREAPRRTAASQTRS